MIVRTEALVLRSMDYRETSKIVTLFTRSHGKISILAKGARGPKSRFGATLEPMSYIQVLFYHKPTRTLQTLSESSHVTLFSGIGQQLDKMTLGLRVMELVQALMQEEEQNPPVFNLVLQTLACLDGATQRTANVWPYFQLRLGGLLGFAANIKRETIQALPEEGGRLLLDRGLIEANLQGQGVRASRAALRIFAIFARADLETIMRMETSPALYREACHLVDAFLKYHLQEAYPTRSEPVVARLLNDTIATENL